MAKEATAANVASEIRLAYLNMPDDVAEAFESMKLAILRHKLSDWREYSELDMLSILGLLAGIATQKEGPANATQRTGN